MDTEIDAPDLEELEPVAEEQEQPEGDAPEAEAEEGDAPLVVTFGDDAPEPEEQGADWVKNLRKLAYERKKEIEQLKAQIGDTQKPAVNELGPEPDIEDFDYDPVAFKAAHREWVKKSMEAERYQDEAMRAEQAQQEAFERKVAAYNEAKAKLPVPDFDDAEAVLIDTFDATQQGLLVKVAKQPAIFAYGLGKNPSRAKALAAIKDPVDFIAEAVRMEVEMKQQSGKRVAAPEKRITGGGVAGAASTDSTLERLRDEAERTGDYTKVNAYKRSLRK